MSSHSPLRSGGTPRSEHFLFADVLRSTAIIAVVASHVVNFLVVTIPIRSLGEPLGYWGVDAFFVLSGFLLGRPYIDAILGRRLIPQTALYARRRFMRIWPAYAVIVLVGAGLTRFHNGRHPASGWDILAHLTMTHSFFPNFIQSDGNSALWTMGVDSQFYVALPICAWMISRLAPSDYGFRLRALIGFLLVASLFCMLWRAFWILEIDTNHVEVQVNQVQRALPGMGICFALGSAIATIQAVGCELSRRIALTLLALGALLAIGMITSPLYLPESLRLFEPTVWDFVGSISVAFTVIGVLYLRSVRINNFSKNRVVAIVADNSYALYLVHMPVMLIVFVTLKQQVRNHSGALDLAIAICFTLAAAASAFALHTFVESPFLSLKERAREIPVASAGR